METPTTTNPSIHATCPAWRRAPAPRTRVVCSRALSRYIESPASHLPVSVRVSPVPLLPPLYLHHVCVLLVHFSFAVGAPRRRSELPSPLTRTHLTRYILIAPICYQPVASDDRAYQPGVAVAGLTHHITLSTQSAIPANGMPFSSHNLPPHPFVSLLRLRTRRPYHET